MKYCPECGNKVEPAEKFCVECGFDLLSLCEQKTELLKAKKSKPSAQTNNRKASIKGKKEDTGCLDAIWVTCLVLAFIGVLFLIVTC